MVKPGDPIGHLAQIVSVTSFGIGIIVQKGLAARYPPADVVALQLAIATALMRPACRRLGYLPRRMPEAAPAVLWGFLTPEAVFLVAGAGAARTDGVSVALIWGLLPLMGPFLGRLLPGALVRPFDVAGIAIIVAGVAIPHALRVRRAAASAVTRRG